MFLFTKKCILCQLGALHLLLLLLFVGHTYSLDEKTETSENDYTSEDEEVSSPGEQVKPTGPLPYFDKVQRTIEVEQKNKTLIDCPVKNFNDSMHTVIWFKGNNIIINGNQSMHNDFQGDGKNNLLIEHFTKETPGTYVCQIEPAKVKQETILKIKENEANAIKSRWHFVIVTLVLVKSLWF